MRRSNTSRVSTPLRLPPQLYQLLTAAAERNQRSMNGEATWRLQQSFDRDDQPTKGEDRNPPRRKRQTTTSSAEISSP